MDASGPRRTTAPRRSARRRALGASFVVTLALVGCSATGDGQAGRGGGSALDQFGGGSTTSQPTDGASAGSLQPRSIPDGFQPLRDDEIGVAIAVPGDWVIADEDLGDLADRAGEQNPNLGGLLDGSSGMLGGSVTKVARGPYVGEGEASSAATIFQLELALPTIPAVVESQIEGQMRAAGATDVETSRISVPGLADDARALVVSATMTVGGQSSRVREVMVPTSLGIALVAITADDATTDAILATLRAR